MSRLTQCKQLVYLLFFFVNNKLILSCSIYIKRQECTCCSIIDNGMNGEEKFDETIIANGVD